MKKIFLFLVLSCLSVTFTFAESTATKESSSVKCLKIQMEATGSLEDAYQNCSVKK